MRAAKVDGNHAQIVAALRRAGAFVQSLAQVGKGCPDLLVIYRGVVNVIEVKDPSKPPSQRRLTQDQKNWHATAALCGYDVPVAEAAEDALRAVGAIS